ncbi:hypothetical protein SAMN05421823_103484 [Catalinimonas alkaloidigena]|uniref:Uncharacterized protein n=2 Tax=Catalinimonas alkaloidigena TaxID=1075417 RepID=A0A1G9EII4_9BACT|nr:hypothetical protein SAMN05421823_103484 [Catalinimonas alkaloidigena]
MLLSAPLLLGSCDRYNHPKDLTQEEMASRPRVYGEPDGPPRQAKLSYEADPNLAENADAARHKLFADQYEYYESGVPVDEAGAGMDSTQAATK